MPIFAIGLNHTTAPVEVRERLAYAETELPDVLKQVYTQCEAQGAVIVSTCNRTEFYLSGSTNLPERFTHWLNTQTQPAINPSHLYQYENREAITHLFSVASGLDSMVMGEPQIAGQIKSAHQLAQTHHMLDAPLNKLFEVAFSASKQVRSETDIGTHPVSIASASIKLAKRIFSDLANTKALVVGAGDTAALVAQHLRKAQVQSMTIANRSIDRAKSIAEENENIIRIADIPTTLEAVDIVISSTGSTLPLLGKGMVETALKSRKHRPYFMIDLAVPRDIEPEVGEMDDVYLYTVDDLVHVVEDNKKTRRAAADAAHPIIQNKVNDYLTWLSGFGVKDTITHLREHIEILSHDSIEKAKQAVKNGTSLDEALAHLHHTFTNKLLHSPSAKLREAAENNDTQLIKATKVLFNLDEL